MMRWIVASSMTFRLLVVVAAVAVLAVGTSQLHKAPVEVLPDFTPTTVEVQTEALGLSAEEVEQLVTVPMEQDLLNGVAFVKDIRSESVPGLSRILMIFEPGTSIFTARQLVAERLTQAYAMPQVSKTPRMIQPLSSTDRVMLVGMSSKTVSRLEMGVLARWTIAQRLVGVPGVANVSVWGLQDRQLQVQVDPARLRDEGVKLEQVIRTSANALWASPLTFVEASTPGTGGFIDTANQRLGIQHESPITTAKDLARVRLEGTTARKLLLGDVATMVEDHQPLIGDAAVASQPGLLLVVQRFPGTNYLDVTRGVEQALDDMKPGLAGIDFDTKIYRPATYVENSIDNVELALLIGLVLLALVLAVFLFRWRTALIGIVVVPLSVLAAVLVLWAFGATINAIVLAGLVAALLLVIDDAIISVDHIDRRLHQRDTPAQASVAHTILEASLEVRRPALYAALILALATVPVFFLERLSGALFPDMAAAFLLALLASLAVAVIVTPALSVVLLSGAPAGRGGAPIVRWLQRRYEGGLSRILPRPPVAYVAVGALLVVVGASTPFLGQKLLPTFKENDLLISWEGPPGTSLPEMNRITARASRELRSIPGVRDVGAHIGRAVTGDQIVNANSSEIWVGIDPRADYDATVAAVKRVASGYPGLSHDVQPYTQERVDQALNGTDQAVVVRVYGEDQQVLAANAARVRQTVSKVDGVVGARVLLPAEEPTVHIRVDLAKADEYGLKPGDVRRAATTLLSGLVVGNLYQQQKVFDVVVWGTPQTRTSLTSVRRLLLETPDGGDVRLGDIADVRIAPSPAVIRRGAVSRYVDVSATVSGADRDAVVGTVKSRLRALSFPTEYHAEVLAGSPQPMWRLISIAVAALVGMFLLLQVFFRSWRLAALSMVVTPIGVAGGVVAVLVAGGTLSFGSYIGLFAVFGIATRWCISLFDRVRQLEKDEAEELGANLVLRAARERIGPVLMTALATTLVSLPVLIMGSRPGLELLHPVAVVSVGGLITSVPFSLLVLPVLYLRFGYSRSAEPRQERPGVLEESPRGAGTRGEPATGVAVMETRAMKPEGG